MKLQYKILNYDCFEVLQKIKSNSIDLILTDPPYCINYKDWDKEDFLEFTEKWVKESARMLKNNGSFWSFMGYQNVCEFFEILEKYLVVRKENWVIWARSKGRGSSKHLKSVREDIIHATKSNKFTWNNIKVLREVICPYTKNGEPRGWFIDENGKRVRWTGLGNVWVYTAPFWKSKDFQYHPAQKPLKLIERLILLSSNENSLILDPFCGSGTTIVAAKNLKRRAIGIEINQSYCEIAEKRLEETNANISSSS